MVRQGILRQPTNIDPYARGDYQGPDDNLDNLIKNWHRYQGNIIVFLGAGASVGAVNARGEKLPQSHGLRNEIYSEFLLEPAERDGFNFDRNLGLMSLEHAAAIAEASASRREVEKFVADRFVVRQPLWQHAVLPFLRPLAVFTTNYDNLIELGWHLQDGRDGTKPLNPLFMETERLSEHFIPLFRSHGSVASPHKRAGEGGLVLSLFDYFEMIPHRQQMLGHFLQNFNDLCLIFIGYSFQDVDLASTLYGIRKDRTGSNWYAVFPRPNPDVREMYREKYRIHQIDRRFHDFLRDLDAKVDFIPEEWKFDKIAERASEGFIYSGDRAAAKQAKKRAGSKKTAGKAASKARPVDGAAARGGAQRSTPAKKGSAKKGPTKKSSAKKPQARGRK